MCPRLTRMAISKARRKSMPNRPATVLIQLTSLDDFAPCRRNPRQLPELRFPGKDAVGVTPCHDQAGNAIAKPLLQDIIAQEATERAHAQCRDAERPSTIAPVEGRKVGIAVEALDDVAEA